MLWLGMRYNAERKRMFRVEVGLPLTISPPAGYVDSGRVDEKGRVVFVSEQWLSQISEAEAEANQLLRDLSIRGGHVVFLRELHISKEDEK